MSARACLGGGAAAFCDACLRVRWEDPRSGQVLPRAQWPCAQWPRAQWPVAQWRCMLASPPTAYHGGTLPLYKHVHACNTPSSRCPSLLCVPASQLTANLKGALAALRIDAATVAGMVASEPRLLQVRCALSAALWLPRTPALPWLGSQRCIAAASHASAAMAGSMLAELRLMRTSWRLLLFVCHRDLGAGERGDPLQDAAVLTTAAQACW